MDPSQAFRASQEKRRKEYAELRKKAEIELLGRAEDMQEYGERLKALHNTIIQPDIPLDEMQMGDYMKMRRRRR
jgi:hypothetical protein